MKPISFLSLSKSFGVSLNNYLYYKSKDLISDLIWNKLISPQGPDLLWLARLIPVQYVRNHLNEIFKIH